MSAGVALRPTGPGDLGYVTSLERAPGEAGLIGQWSDAEHLAAIRGEDAMEHWIIERDGRAAGYLIAFDELARCGGVYLKRILVAEKDRGTGRLAVAAFLDEVFARPAAEFVWLCVRSGNERAQAVYRRLGFRRYGPSEAEAEGLGPRADVPEDDVFRMRIDAVDWCRGIPDR